MIPVIEAPLVDRERQYKALDLCFLAVTNKRIDWLTVAEHHGTLYEFGCAYVDDQENAIFIEKRSCDRIDEITVRFFNDAYILRKDTPINEVPAALESWALRIAYRKIQKARMV